MPMSPGPRKQSSTPGQAPRSTAQRVAGRNPFYGKG